MASRTRDNMAGHGKPWQAMAEAWAGMASMGRHGLAGGGGGRVVIPGVRTTCAHTSDTSSHGERPWCGHGSGEASLRAWPWLIMLAVPWPAFIFRACFVPTWGREGVKRERSNRSGSV